MTYCQAKMLHNFMKDFQSKQIANYMLQSLVFGLMKTYLLQNTQWSDDLHYIKLLYSRFIAQGHTRECLNPVFMAAAENLSNTRLDIPSPAIDMVRNKCQISTNKNHLFFHVPFHPKEITRREIQISYSQTCDREDGTSFRRLQNDETDMWMSIDRLTVAYSRPRNLRDILNPKRLPDMPNNNVSNHRQRGRTWIYLN